MEEKLFNTSAVNSTEPSVEDVYDIFWKPLLENEDGSINTEQLKKELFDFKFMLDEVPKVYMDITGGTLSKPNYHAGGVIDCANRCYEEIYKERVKDMLSQLVEIGDLKLNEYPSVDDIIQDYI